MDKVVLPFIAHDDFDGPGARARYAPDGNDEVEHDLSGRHLPDDLSKELTARMHYAAFRAGRCERRKDLEFWERRYYAMRDRVVLGNLKLIFRVVRRHLSAPWYSEDMVGECQVVLLRAVALYNPWRGIRFSTYAYTCLMRAVGRRSRQVLREPTLHVLNLDAFSWCQDDASAAEDANPRSESRLSRFFRQEDGVLTPREKVILARRFMDQEGDRSPTLECVGRELGLSKERVRQLQEGALQKLRESLASTAAR